MKYIYLLLLITGYPAQILAQSLPGFDILLADLDVSGSQITVSHIRNVTNRQGYDNQTYFMSDGQHLLYTSSLTKNGHQQTDIIRYNLTTDTRHNLTKTDASEYSPTPFNNDTHFSVIRVGKNNKQYLWQYPFNGDTPTQILSTEPVGYHAWIDSDRVLLFILGTPHTLQIANITHPNQKTLDDRIGASLYNIPQSHKMSYNKARDKEEKNWQVMSLDPATGEQTVLAALPDGSYYYTWLSEKALLTAQHSLLVMKDLTTPSKEAWTTIADLSESCPKGLSRIAVNATQTKIAMVCSL